MFATIRRYNIDPEKTDELVARVSGVAEIFKAMPGHVAYYLVRSDGGILTAVGVFTDRASAEASRQMAARWVTENIADLLGAPTNVTVGEIVVHG
jgi:quinol monooxygenase YgiN